MPDNARCLLALSAFLALPSPLQAEPPPAQSPAPTAPVAPPPPGTYPPPGSYRPPGYLPPGYYRTPDSYPIFDGRPPPGQDQPEQAGSPPSDVALATSAQAISQAQHGYSWGAALAGGVESAGASTSVVTAPVLEGSYVAHRFILLHLTLGFGFLVDNQGLGESTFRFGNPQASAHYRTDRGRWRIAAGLGVTGPLAHVELGPDGRLQATVYNRSLAMGGMWNQWLWYADRMAVPAIFRVSYHLPSGVTLVVQHADAILLGVRGENTGTHFVGQLAFEAQFPLRPTFTLTPRLQTVLLPAAGIDRWQTAAALRGTLKTKVGSFFVGCLVSLDEPIAAQPGVARWGFHLGKEIEP